MLNKNSFNWFGSLSPASSYALAIIFVGASFCFTVGCLYLSEKSRWRSQAQEVKSGTNEQGEVYPQPDSANHDQLEKALFPADLGLTAAQNPFIDRANLSAQKPAVLQTVSTGVPVTQSTLAGMPTAPGGIVMPNALPSSAPSPGPTSSGDSQAASELNNRLRDRERASRAGDSGLPSIATVFDVDDVEPIGTIGGKDAEKVLFRSKSTKKVFSVPLGARFNNGTLKDAEPTGVKIERDGNKAVEKKFWAKNQPLKETEAEPVLPSAPKN